MKHYMDKKHKNTELLFAFFGTPHLSVYVLDALEAQGMVPALMVTAPNKPQGRGLEFTPTPVKTWALERGIDVITPRTLKDETFVAEMHNTEWNVFIVAAYAKMIPRNILDIPQHGCLNVHPSLLPKFRGPSPIISSILADDRMSGVSIIQLSEMMDAGPILAQARIEIAKEEWPLRNSVLEEMLFTEGGNILAETLSALMAGEITPIVQDESLATYTKKWNSADALVDLQANPRESLLKIRAFDSGPRAHCFIENNGKHIRLIITDAEIRNGILHLLRIIPEGKKEMDYEDFMRSVR